MSENIYRNGNVCINAPFTINDLDDQDAKRPWANSTKNGPGRKHQQGKPVTKSERNKE